MNILADASLPELARFFPQPFVLTLYNRLEDVRLLLKKQAILLCRSTLKVDEALLQNSNLSYVATASSGTDHIDKPYLATRAITLVDARGSNAHAVADYVLATIACLQQQNIPIGKKAAVVGVGAVGSEIARRLAALSFEVILFDPPKSLMDSEFTSDSLQDVLACDVICIHANLHDTPPYPSRHLIGTAELGQLKPNTVIINAARGDIVSEKALLALQTPIYYCTDVFANEPQISEQTVAFSHLCTPHIAGHSVEAKVAAIRMLSCALHHHLKWPCPIWPSRTSPQTDFFTQKSWQSHVLSYYNPVHESRALKQAIDKKQAFIDLRKAHSNRHEF